jgi:ABC-type multidrug transport system fused ATPase/permease subunit
MMLKQSVLLWRSISHRRRIQFSFLLILMMLVSLTEFVSIGAIFPLLSLLSNPGGLNPQHSLSSDVLVWIGGGLTDDMFLVATVFFVGSVLVSAFLRLLMMWISTKLSFSTGADISNDMYRRTLYQPYAIHISRNTSEVVSGIFYQSTGVIFNIIMPTLTLISSSALLIVILCGLLYINSVAAASTFLGFGAIYYGIIKSTKSRTLINSKRIAKESALVIKSLNEGLGGIRDVLIDNTQHSFCETFRTSDLALRNAQSSAHFIGTSPRYIIESLGMILIAGLAYFMSRQSSDISEVIPMLGLLAMGAQKILPILQQMYSSWINIKSSEASLSDVLAFLNQPIPDKKVGSFGSEFPFLEKIYLKNIFFKYQSEQRWILQDLSLEINKGSKIGIVGRTGCGKSTLTDLIMGLLTPISGQIYIDNKCLNEANIFAWQRHIAHVPQNIFLSDATITENIAFGVPFEQIDFEKVKRAASQAKISDSIESWTDQYLTKVGERGVRLSGGQRQRIGIARAFYKNANVIILDEATSALDGETENEVMETISNLATDITLIIVAHRLSTLEICDQIIDLSGIEN